MPTEKTDVKNAFLTSLISGAAAGATCDIVFFPLDTLKTRLQSQHGFIHSGGFRKLYQGILPVAIGSAPTAAFFFVTYDGIKQTFEPYFSSKYHSIIHMSAALCAEMVACLIRVPVEVIKQRRQALLVESERLKLRTLYRGYGSTVLRDLPFALIQMTLWEHFKLWWTARTKRNCTPLEGAICGAASVAVSAALTTPLDVAKTRIMLSSTSADAKEVRLTNMLKEIYRNGGARGLFAGFTPRVAGFTVGGFAFFGIYEQVREFCESRFSNRDL